MNTPQPSPTDVAKAIETIFAKLPDQLVPGTKDRDWTRQLKENIGNLGDSYGWRICTSGFKDHFDCEWLYDLTWYRNDSDNHLSEVFLVLESEWALAQSAIKYDFEKLLLAKATLKVMVFQASEKDLQTVFSLLERGIQAFYRNSVDEIYIFAGFNLNEHKFFVRYVPSA